MDDHFEKYYLKAVFYLKFRGRSVKEMQEYLKKKNVPQEMADKVVARLLDEKFLNDRNFAKDWIESRARFRPKGRRIVEMELKQKGITKEIIDEVMQEGPSEDAPDEAEQLRRLVEQRIGKYKGMERYEIYQKLGAYLGRRGFNWDQIKRSIDSELSRS
jgi:regulatory protein